MAQDTGKTYKDALQKVLSQLAVAGTLPDADVQFNSQLTMVITGFLKQAGAAGIPGAQGAGDPTQGQPATPGQPGGGAPPPPPGPGGGQMGPGLSAAMNPGPGGPQAAPNADELRRVLSGG